MIVKIGRSGTSFKGLTQYLTHDPKAETSERVAWTHTLNLANDHIPSAVDEMYRTYDAAEALKDEAGIKRGGQALEKPVKHVSLNWNPDDAPTQEHMIETAESFLKHMGWHEHQAIVIAHNDKEYDHLHIELNSLHPETGLKLDEGLERRRAKEWRLEYMRTYESSRSEEQNLHAADRSETPTRPAWEIMKEAERQFQAAEDARRGPAECQPAATPEEGDPRGLLKQQQREEREAFFAGGKEAYKEARDAAFREVREEFRGDWREFYAAQRDGLDAGLLQEIKAGLIAAQSEALTLRRDEMSTTLREDRDADYTALLAQQQADRGILAAHMAAGNDGREWIVQWQSERGGDRDIANENDPNVRDFAIVAEASSGLELDFRQAAMDTCERMNGCEPNVFETFGAEGTPGSTAAEDARVRNGIDLGTNLVTASIGGLTILGERLFDGFLDDAPRPSAPRNVVQSEEGEPKADVFAAAANAARRRAELEEDETRRNEWWDERRARSRD